MVLPFRHEHYIHAKRLYITVSLSCWSGRRYDLRHTYRCRIQSWVLVVWGLSLGASYLLSFGCWYVASCILYRLLGHASVVALCVRCPMFCWRCIFWSQDWSPLIDWDLIRYTSFKDLNHVWCCVDNSKRSNGPRQQIWSRFMDHSLGCQLGCRQSININKVAWAKHRYVPHRLKEMLSVPCLHRLERVFRFCWHEQ